MRKLLGILSCLAITQCAVSTGSNPKVNWSKDYLGIRSPIIEEAWKKPILKALILCRDTDDDFGPEGGCVSSAPEVWPYLSKIKDKHHPLIDPSDLYKTKGARFVNHDGSKVIVVCIRAQNSKDGSLLGIWVDPKSNSSSLADTYRHYFAFEKRGSGWKMVNHESLYAE